MMIFEKRKADRLRFIKKTSDGQFFYVKHSVINIVITRYFPTVVSKFFNNLGKVVVDGIKFQIMVVAPADGMVKCLTGSAGPEDEFVALFFPFDQIVYEWPVRFSEIRPLAIAECSVKINGDCLKCVLRFIFVNAPS